PDADTRALAAQVRCPVLVAWATRDRFVQLRRARAAIATLPNARLVTFRAGHAPHLETPDAFEAQLHRFFVDIDAAAGEPARFAGYDSDFGLAPHFHMDNRGKRSVALDLALPQAVDALRRLVDRADVLVTNMLPARLAKYGLDPAALHARRPELIVARISGFG